METKITSFLTGTFRRSVSVLAVAGVLATGIERSSAQVTYTFTSASATGAVGPTQTQINTAYGSTNLNGSVVATSGIQSFTIPVSGPYRITAIGAQGGYNGGYGASIAGEFTLTAGTVLKILVGQQGTQGYNGSYNSGGGGGGSYVTSPSNVPYVVAGGGGGNGDGYGGSPLSCCLSGMQGTTSTSGNNPPPSGSSGGGSGGGGGTCYSSLNAGAGAGINGNGSVCQSGGAALSFTNGGTGGTEGGGTGTSGTGGFGGGGGGYNSGVGNRGGGGGGYSGGGGGYAPNGNEPNAAGGGGGSYNAGANQVNGVSSTGGSGKVLVELLCNITLLASTSNPTAPSICSGNSVTLTTNAVSNYSWSTGNTTSSVIVVSPGVTTTYSVSGTSSANCTAYNAITVIVNSVVPSLSISNPSNNICLGNTATLTASGALSYTWTGGVTNAQTFTPSATSSYTVTGSNGCGTSTAVTSITVAPLPVPALASPATVCASNAATLSASGAVTYTWNPGAQTGSVVTVAPAANTVYTVTGTNGPCIGTSTLLVATKPNPTLNIVGSSTTICVGESVSLTVSGASTYTWFPPVSTGASAVDSPTIPTLYQIIGTNSVGCTTGTSWPVNVLSPPTVVTNISSTVICPGGSVVLGGNGATNYTWTGGPNTSTYMVSPSTSQVYHVMGSGTSNTCVAAADVTVNVAQPVLPVSPSTAICNGAAITLTAGAGNNYNWQPGGGSFSSLSGITPTVTTIYTVSAEVTDMGVTCPTSSTILVTVHPNPTITVSSTSTLVCRRDPITLTANGGVSYAWFNQATGAATTFTTLSTGPQSYTVEGTDANGCTSVAAISMSISSCNGIAENRSTGLMIYPNPSRGEFFIRSERPATLHVFNALGQQVKTLTISTGEQQVVTGLANGAYVITAEGDASVRQTVIIDK